MCHVLLTVQAKEYGDHTYGHYFKHTIPWHLEQWPEGNRLRSDPCRGDVVWLVMVSAWLMFSKLVHKIILTWILMNSDFFVSPDL